MASTIIKHDPEPLKLARCRLGLSLKDVAVKARVSVCVVQRVISGECSQPEAVKRVARALRVSMHKLYL